MQDIDKFMDDMKVDIIKEALISSRHLMDRLSQYDDMPSSKTFEEDMILRAKDLSKRLYSSTVLLEYIHGD